MIKIYTFLFALMASGFCFGQQNLSTINTLTSASQTTDGDAYELNADLVFIKLRASAASNSYRTDIYFNDNASLGFDLGYDASFFGGIPSFVLYSLLAEGNVGVPYIIQAVNTDDLLGVEIPLGLNASAGVELTISIEDSTLPEFTNIYLYDAVANSSTLLNTSDYVFTPSTSLSGSGRYFLRIAPPGITYTYDGSWSPFDPNGIATPSDDILIVSDDTIIDSNTSCNSVTVNPGAGLTVDTGITLTTATGLTLESTSTSYSSLILDGSVAGTMTYERHVNINGTGTTGSNDLISAPLTGQAFSAFASANPNLFSNVAGDLFLFGPFDKTTAQYLTYADTESATLDAGIGYRAATDNNSTLRFTGTAENGTVTNDIVNSGPEFEVWNLVGNPYPSYLNVQAFLNHDVGGGVTNLDLFDAGSAAIYGYDGNANNGWTIYNLSNTTASTVIAPGQGFFVSADATNAGLYDLEFTPDMRATGTSDDFIPLRNAELVYLKVNLSSNSNSYQTDFYFNPNASLGLDLGYDASVWGGTAPDFGIYSHLVEDNTGSPMALQALNASNLSDVTIPLGVEANQGQQLTFSISDSTLPDSVNVYLDDTVANTSTLLNNSDYVMVPNTNLSGTGRFFLRTSEDALSTMDNSLDSLHIFALNSSKELVVSGLLRNNTLLTLYDIQGRTVLSNSLDRTSLENRIDVSNITTGVYIVRLKNNKAHKTQKVIIN